MKAFNQARFLFLLPAVIFLTILLPAAKAQTFVTLTNFTTASGTLPQASLISFNNVFYGTAYSGGSSGYGTIFRVNGDGTQFTVLHNFSLLQGTNSTNIDGANPKAALVLGTSNVLYGTTSLGGTNGAGTIFALGTNGTGFTVLHHFTFPAGTLFTNKDGANPAAGLILSGSTLYGTAENGGPYGSGTLFSLQTNGTIFTVVHAFSPLNAAYPYYNTDGAKPVAPLILSNDTLYGTTSIGGSQGSGTVFKANTNSTLFTTLHNFSTVSYAVNGDGANPFGGLVLTNGVLYGTATNGGLNGKGTIFAVGTDGLNFTNLHSFYEATEGSHPVAGLVISSNSVFGTTSQGGQFANGGLFFMNLDGTGFTNIYTFSARSSGANTDGSYPNSSVLFANGAIYGTTQQGGAYRNGTLFRLSFHPAFFAGEISLGNDIYYLNFPGGNLFGYYTYDFFPYLYHYDLGFEYFLDANDGSGSAYFYDFSSSHFWYTGPSTFPNVYDFTLNSWIYYFPATNNAGHYSSNPRQFYNYNTGHFFSE